MGKVGRPFKAQHEKKGPGITVYLLPAEMEYIRKVQRREGSIDRSPAVSKIITKAMAYDALIAKRQEETKNAKNAVLTAPPPIDTLEKSLRDAVKAYEAVKQELDQYRTLALLQDPKGNANA